MNEKSPIQPSLEQINEAVVEKVRRAINNAISKDRLDEIEEELEFFNAQYIKNEGLSDEDLATVREIEDERDRSIATVGNITEFRMMLDYLEERFGPKDDWIKSYLAHENAHANVAEATGHNFIGYSIEFVKLDDSGSVYVQPGISLEPQPEWGREELLRKRIAVTLAPEHYGDVLSVGDEADWHVLERELEKVRSDNKQQTKISAKFILE